MDREYRTDIDAIKGIAMIAIIFYHIGMLPNGFLGVEAFLVINGFLIIPPLVNSFQKKEFRFIPWFTKRLFRLWPIVLIASIVCLAVGYWIMIPDSYENLAQSVVASNLFTNNILSAITTKNYWNVANEFKPLMQMWYLGVVVQFYLLFPLLLYAGKTCFKRFRNSQKFWKYLVAVIGALSFIGYIFLPDTFSNKFYFVQYRIWEFCIGGFIGLTLPKIEIKKIVSCFLYIALCALFLIGAKSITQVDTMTVIGMEEGATGNTLKIIFTVVAAILTGIILLTNIKWGGVFLLLGKMSLSLFVWHQVVLAFIRYGFIENLNWIGLLIYSICILAISYGSYKLIESIKCRTRLSRLVIVLSFVITSGIASLIYRNAGVVRDVPELGISLENPLANRNTEYTDQVYNWNNTFESEKPHVLIVGNSFARDFACILMEYDNAKKLELAYAFDFDKVDSTTIADTDYLFVFGSKSKIPKSILEHVPQHCQSFGIGTKSYGKNFGIFYAKRHNPDYFEQSIESHPIVDRLNSKWKQEWGANNFIDIMEATRLPDGTIRIFTPEHKVISFDCNHLTQDGCKFYATRLNLDKILNNESK